MVRARHTHFWESSPPSWRSSSQYSRHSDHTRTRPRDRYSTGFIGWSETPRTYSPVSIRPFSSRLLITGPKLTVSKNFRETSWVWIKIIYLYVFQSWFCFVLNLPSRERNVLSLQNRLVCQRIILLSLIFSYSNFIDFSIVSCNCRQ